MNDLKRLNFLWPESTPKVTNKRDTEFDFYEGKLLGKGGFGEVRKCISK